MAEVFLDVQTVEEVTEKLVIEFSGWKKKTESIPFRSALGRILSEDVRAEEDVPGFARSTVDGYAVRASDTGGASGTIPSVLEICGEIVMGEEALFSVSPGKCALIPTGGMLPPGSDAVVMLEDTEEFSASEAGICRAVTCGENTVREDEDIQSGRVLLKSGKKLRPQDLGVLSAAGIREVRVFRKWSLTIFSTGDELVRPEEKPRKGQVRDINTDMLSALAESFGMTVNAKKVVRDDETLLKKEILEAMQQSDIVAVSGGSSKGKKDAAARVFREISDGGLLAHGLALKPGKPTVIACDRQSDTLLLGLPGHPAAAMMVFRILMKKLQCRLTGEAEEIPVSGRLAVNLPSAPGRLTCQPVTVSREIGSDGRRLVTPLFGKSGLIRILSEADGYIEIGRDSEGLRCGEAVDVHLF
ncbi:MAG: molybdopterin molybdotransferase MoeA [Lachnospiraceae bacterium]|jgi:molybdopterin molybdotransferase|nr:molybdopterin molybdotransferase MoeA [Lachnospiraceae bacterium]